MSNSTLADGFFIMCNAALEVLPDWVVKLGISALSSVLLVGVIFLIIFSSSPRMSSPKTSPPAEEKSSEPDEEKEDEKMEVTDGEEESEEKKSSSVSVETSSESSSIPTEPSSEHPSISAEVSLNPISSEEQRNDVKEEERSIGKILMLEELPRNISHIKNIYLPYDNDMNKISSSEFYEIMSIVDEYALTLDVSYICEVLRNSTKRVYSSGNLAPLRNIIVHLEEIVDEWEEIKKRSVVTIFSFIESLVSLGKICSDIRSFIKDEEKIEGDAEKPNLGRWREMSDIVSWLETLSRREVHISLQFSKCENEAITAELKSSLVSGVMSCTSQYLYILHSIG